MHSKLGSFKLFNLFAFNYIKKFYCVSKTNLNSYKITDIQSYLE